MAAAPATTAPRRTSRPPRPTVEAAGPRLEVAAPPRRSGRWVAAIALAALVGLIGVVGLSAAGAQLAFAQSELEADIAALESRVDALEGEVAELRAPERIEAIATEELGMEPVEDPRFVEAAPAGAEPAAAVSRDGPGGAP